MMLESLSCLGRNFQFHHSYEDKICPVTNRDSVYERGHLYQVIMYVKSAYRNRETESIIHMCNAAPPNISRIRKSGTGNYWGLPAVSGSRVGWSWLGTCTQGCKIIP